jgi:two-component system, OmpR family, sensor kinase
VSPLDLRGRVTLASLAALAVGLVALGAATNLLLRHALNGDASSVLRDRAAAQLTTLHEATRGVRVAEANDAALDRQSWVFAGGHAVERPVAPADLTRKAARLARVTRPTEASVGDELRLRAVPAYGTRGGRHRIATVVVGVSLLPYRHAERVALLGTVVLGLFVLLTATVATRRAVGAALRPVAEMTDRAADWSEHDLHRRFDLGPPRDELTRLAATLDGLLARIDAALRHEQRFSAEMAHELRTPLSGVRAEAELALRERQDPEPLRRGMQRILEATDRMDAAIKTLLTVARGQATHAPGSCDPFHPMEHVTDSMRQAAAAHGVAVDLHAAPGIATVGAGEDVVTQALHPLLENAIRHAESRVVVALRPGGGAVAIRIADDGPGVPPGSEEEIFQPGTSSTGGAGLGLPLARRLARSCGGDVRVSQAAVELVLPP